MNLKAVFVAVGYLILVCITIGYELSRRIYHAGTSEFAGMLSTFFTLPSNIRLSIFARVVAGVRIGDSNATFVVILGLSGLVNACIIYAVARLLFPPSQGRSL